MLTNSHISPGVYDYTGDLSGESEATRRYQDTVGVTEISYRRGEYFTYLGLLLLWKEAYNQSASLCEQGKHLGGGHTAVVDSTGFQNALPTCWVVDLGQTVFSQTFLVNTLPRPI